MKSVNLCLFLFLFSSFILSEEKRYDEVVTVVSKIPKEYYKLTSTVDLVDIEELEKYQPASVIGLLSNNLAIDTSSNGGPGQVSSIFLRGSNSNHSLVKVNGVKINPSTAGGASIYNLDTSLISNIEIGFNSDENEVHFISQEKTEKIDKSSKQIIAEKIIKKVTKYFF